MTRAVLFDIDDTLIDFRRAVTLAFRRHLIAVAPVVAHDEAQRAWAQLGEHYFARFLAGEISFEEQRVQRTRAFCERYQIAIGPGDAGARAWYASFDAQCDRQWRTFNDVHPALRALRAAGIRVGAVSNSGHAAQARKLRRVGLHPLVEALVCCDDVGVAKPAPGMFLAGCAALGTAPEQTAYVGDSLSTDARGACAAGLQGWWLNRTNTPGDFIRTVTDLHQLVDRLPDATSLARRPEEKEVSHA